MEVIISLYSGPVRPHLWPGLGPLVQDIDQLEGIQHRSLRWSGLEHFPGAWCGTRACPAWRSGGFEET